MDRFLIAPFNVGLQTDLKPWMVPDEAFVRMRNSYVFRGRVRKRFGSMYMGLSGNMSQQGLNSRLAVRVGTTNSSGNVSGTVPGAEFNIGQSFSIGTAIFTVYQLGTPGAMYRNDNVSGTATFNTTTGAFVINGAAITTAVYYYPSLPVMGLALYEITPINNQPAYAFDTQFAYTFSNGMWIRSGSGTTPQWEGSDLNFFQIENWDGETPNEVVMFVTNYNYTAPTPAATDDPIWYFDGTNWATYSSPVAPYTVVNSDGTFIFTARIIVVFQGRLLMLNTVEQTPGSPAANDVFVNRCRYSLFGSPFTSVTSGSDVAPYAFLQINQSYTVGAATANGHDAGFIDAPTEEAIISAEFIKDRLIVYFERSTFELAFVGNQIDPFVWQRINTELGSESPHSTVPFDKLVITIGSSGVHACNGANVERIDTKIPDEVFQISTTNQQIQRVYGVRDYYTEMVYWSFPSFDENPNDIYPNRVLVYNYRNDSWGFNDDCITCFGYFEQATAFTWSQLNFTWSEWNMAWDSGVLESQARQVIGGNQQGFVFYIKSDLSNNAAVMQLTNVSSTYSMLSSTTGLFFTIVNHTLQEADYIYIQSASQTFTNPVTGNTQIFQVSQIIDSNTILINPITISATYTGGAFIGRVSQIDILSKQWNPYNEQGRDVYLAKIDFNVLKTTAGTVTVDYYPSFSELSMITEGTGTGTIMGTGVLELYPYTYIPIEQYQSQLWHQVYFQAQGSAMQIRIYYSDTQMVNAGSAFSDFELEGMVLHTQATSARLQ